MIDSLLGEQQENIDPYTTFVYGIRSPYTKESYLRRLRGFFDAIHLDRALLAPSSKVDGSRPTPVFSTIKGIEQKEIKEVSYNKPLTAQAMQ